MKANKQAELKTKAVTKKEEEEKKHTAYGKVPKYLEKINKQREDEAAKVRAAI